MGRIDLATRFADTRDRVATQPTAPALPDPTVAKWQRLHRKEIRLRPDQLTDLTGLALALMRRRRVRTERITENSLIRIAIDILLENQDLLEGPLRRSYRSA